MLQRQPDEIGGFETEALIWSSKMPTWSTHGRETAGAQIVDEIHDADYGGRGFSCRDNEGHLWHVGSYDPVAGTATDASGRACPRAPCPPASG